MEGPETDGDVSGIGLAIPSDHILSIAIVGAGIGGLAVALGLRRNGHQVHIYERSRFADEVGAAVQLAPNSNGVLRRWGIFAENLGGSPMDCFIEKTSDGHPRQINELTEANKRWQHPWHLVHRVDLHDHLKHLATSDIGVGTPVELHTASTVVAVDTEQGMLTLQDDSTVTADLVIGADGIYSMTRKYIKDTKLFSSGKAAFRFLIPREVAESDPVTAPLVARRNTLILWFGDDRRIVMYPCRNNELLNFVCIHPDPESHATEGDEWNKQSSIEQVLKTFRDFDPAVKALMGKVDPSAVQVWQLLDMEKLPTWRMGKLVLLGDAAHPFTPHQGQGAGQAIEDAAALTSVLPWGTSPSDIPERLKIYEEIRYKRAHAIQEYSRLAGKDWKDGKPSVDMMTYTNYNFGHDVIDHSRAIFQHHRWSRAHPWPHLPCPFGPFPLRKHSHPTGYFLYSLPTEPHQNCPNLITTTVTKFKTSRTFLETLFPSSTGLRFFEPDTVATASLIAKSFSFGDGTTSTQLGLYIYGAQSVAFNGCSKLCTYLPLMLTPTASENSRDGNSRYGPRVKCDVSVEYDKDTANCRVVASSEGVSFIEIRLSGLVSKTDSPTRESEETPEQIDVLAYPSGEIMKLDDSEEEDWDSDEEWERQPECLEEEGWEEEAQDSCRRNISVAGRRRTVVVPEQGGKGVELKIDARSWDELPTLRHIAAVLAEIPVYEILGASVEELER